MGEGVAGGRWPRVLSAMQEQDRDRQCAAGSGESSGGFSLEFAIDRLVQVVIDGQASCGHVTRGGQAPCVVRVVGRPRQHEEFAFLGRGTRTRGQGGQRACSRLLRRALAAALCAPLWVLHSSPVPQM